MITLVIPFVLEMEGLTEGFMIMSFLFIIITKARRQTGPFIESDR